MLDELLTAWRKNQRISLDLISQISDAGMGCSLSTRGGRSVARQFAHMHNVRIMQLGSRAKMLSEGASKFASKDEPSPKELSAAFEESSKLVEQWFRMVTAGEKGARPMPGGIVTTLCYLVSHESHHRGSILLTLKQCGEPAPKDARDRLWGEWGKKPS